jgi:hypothetical protein
LSIEKDRYFNKEQALREKTQELESLRFLFQKQSEDLDKYKKEEKKSLMRNSHMFHINATPDKVPKCTDDCLIF